MRAKIKTSFSSKINAIGLPILALCWVSFFWGTTWLASKEGVKYMPALQLAGIRQFIGGILYVGFFLYKKTPWPKGKQWKVIFILSILNFVLSNGLSTWGVKYISSGLGAIIGAIFPLWIVLISQPLKRAIFNFHKNRNIIFRIEVEQIIKPKNNLFLDLVESELKIV
ncbi:EamA family transporter, partial [Flavobacterium sp.]|uniref:DMT family transporter n=1 Tax=Flavobacterium sp. TaxID=239 RepID=UPI00286E83BC